MLSPTLLSQSEYTLLYFYPKDDTPGCTMEASDFTRLVPDFAELGIQIIGVSRDSETSHAKFCNKYDLGIQLISDESWELHEQYGVIGEKKNYGKVYIGVIRSTFLLDNTWKILHEWRNVKATGHAEKVLREVRGII
jgi:thioredoxin-dependent peroxiredoxin